MGDVSWTPLDMLSRIMVELMLRDYELEETWTKFHHLDNPKSCEWSSLVPVVQEYFSFSDTMAQKPNEGVEDKMPRIVDFGDWVQILNESGQQKDMNLKKNPGLKLLEFYQSLNRPSKPVSKLTTVETCKRSETMRTLKAVDGDWMLVWLDQWRF
jgi:hypothetical protein